MNFSFWRRSQVADRDLPWAGRFFPGVIFPTVTFFVGPVSRIPSTSSILSPSSVNGFSNRFFNHHCNFFITSLGRGISSCDSESPWATLANSIKYKSRCLPYEIVLSLKFTATAIQCFIVSMCAGKRSFSDLFDLIRCSSRFKNLVSGSLWSLMALALLISFMNRRFSMITSVSSASLPSERSDRFWNIMSIWVPVIQWLARSPAKSKVVACDAVPGMVVCSFHLRDRRCVCACSKDFNSVASVPVALNLPSMLLVIQSCPFLHRAWIAKIR